MTSNKTIKKTSDTSLDNLPANINFCITQKNTQIRNTLQVFKRKPKIFYRKRYKLRKYWNGWFVFPYHNANGRLKSKNKCGILHFQKDLDEVTFTLTAPAKAVFLLACGLCLLLIIPVIIPKKTCHFCHVNLFTCSLLL